LLGQRVALVLLDRGLATNRVITCSLIRNRKQACGDGTKLDCYDMIFAAGEFDMTIITLDILYFMLSCQLATTDATLVLHGRRAAVMSHTI
jgi:hypothetical protein